MQRCPWPNSPAMIKYHDKEWGVPLHDDRKHFEFFILDAFQAGLSWAIIIKKRGGFEKAFKNFDINKVAKFTKKDVERLVKDESIICNRMKIDAAIENAKRFIEIQKEFGSFDKYIWSFVKNKPIKNKWTSLKQLPAKTELSDAMCKDLKSRGFKFCGSTICYAYMQAAGLVNDHMADCFRYKQC